MTSHVFENATQALPALLHEVLDKGHEVASRNGLTRELAMQQITLKNPFPAEITTPTRRVSLPAQIAETMWILAGRNDIGWLSHYLPRATDFSDDGKTWRGGYGPRLRAFAHADGDAAHGGIDQLEHVVTLLRNEPETRRAVLNIYDPVIDTAAGKDVPCNNWVHFLPRDGVLNAHIAIRSNDLMWGWSGINTFEWSSLLAIVSGLTSLRPGSITFSISSLHLYERHFKRATKIVEAAKEDTWPLTPRFAKGNPRFNFPLTAGMTMANFDRLVTQWFDIEALIRKGGGNAGALRHVIDQFPEPMLRSWLLVLLAWNNDDPLLAADLQQSSLFYALVNSPKKADPTDPTPIAEVAKPAPVAGSFGAFVSDLHRDKHAAYGDSWKKRGEMLGIMANLARKIDRLGVSGGGDTAADTAIDLLAYAVKYRLWLCENSTAPRPAAVPAEGQLTSGPEHADYVTALVMQQLASPDMNAATSTSEKLITAIRSTFDSLEKDVEAKWGSRWTSVDALIKLSTPLAQRCWMEEQSYDRLQEAWKASNADRAFTGYAAEGEVA